MGKVLLDVVVGEGHSGAIRVRVDQNEVARGEDELRGVDLGEAGDLRGKQIRVRAVVSPLNAQTDRTSVRCVLKSDGAGVTHDCEGPPPQGEGIRFRIDFDVA